LGGLALDPVLAAALAAGIAGLTNGRTGQPPRPKGPKGGVEAAGRAAGPSPPRLIANRTTPTRI